MGTYEAMAKLAPTGISLWLGGHDSVTEGGWEWTDGSPFKYIHWNGGNPDDYYGEDCLTMLIGSGKWNDDNCNYNRGYICKRRANTPEPPPPHDGYMTALVCQDSTAVLHCPDESVINIQSAFYGRRSDDICPHLDGSGAGSCDVPGILPHYRKSCDNRPFYFLYAHVETDPCPTVAKYLEMTYTCEQKVCLQGLGVEDGNITNSQLTASSSIGSFPASNGRLNGNSCWKPAGTATSSWIQADLGETRKVTGIVIQGCPMADQWITTFSVKHSMDGISWTDYTADGPSFPGATDRNTPENQLLGTPVSAQYIQIFPLEYEGVAGLRFDILGCSPDYAVTCSYKPNFYESNACAAAIHAGVLLNDVGGDVTLLKKDGLDFYAGSTRNGITSTQSDKPSSTAYTFADGELRCSGPDWYEFGDFCYEPFSAQKTWDDAQRDCSQVGANLVSILSMNEQMWLESYLYMATSHVWTGLNDKQFTGLFQWNDGHQVTMTYWAPHEPNNHDGYSEDCVEMLYTVGTGEVSAAWIGMVLFGITDGQAMWMDQSPVIYTHWGAGEPNNAHGEEYCVSMNRNQGGWNDMNCGTPAGYVCKKFPRDIHTPVPPTQPWEGNCPAGWLRFNNKCSLFRGQKDDIKANWSYARAVCREQQGDLAVIDSQYENDFVNSYLRDMEQPDWIGLSDVLVENQYGWCDGISPVLYTNWATNEPNNAGGTEDCVSITHSYLMSGKWNDDACSAARSFVCSRKKSAAINPPPPTKTPCSGDYISWYNSCYRLVTEPATWDAAQAACQQQGANLASIDTSYEQAFVSGVVLQGKADAWIGLRSPAGSNSYKWSDGWPVFYTHWGPGEPSNNTGEGCVSMHGGLFFHGLWNDTKCDDPKPYICKITTDQIPPTPAPGDGKCLHRWTPYGRYCYRVFNEKSGSSWPEARHQCQQFQGELVSIHSRAEMEFMRTIEHSKFHHVWIGLSRDTNFGWAWSDNTPVAYLNWAPGEPNMAFHPGQIAEENCVEMYPDGRWNDNNCMQKRGFACRHRQYYTTDDGGNIIIPTDPAPFNNSGLIAGATIGAIVAVTLILGLLYYLHTVKGIKLSAMSLPSRTANKVDVPAFNNPNFAAGESDT